MIRKISWSKQNVANQEQQYRLKMPSIDLTARHRCHRLSYIVAVVEVVVVVVAVVIVVVAVVVVVGSLSPPSSFRVFITIIIVIVFRLSVVMGGTIVSTFVITPRHYLGATSYLTWAC